MKKINMNEVNRETLTHLNAPRGLIQLFNVFISGLDASMVSFIEGGYNDYKKWLMENFVYSTYDEYGNRIKYANDTGVVQETTYDDKGRPIFYSDNTGNNWVKTYTKHGHVATKYANSKYNWVATYDDNGNQLTFRDVLGYSWDATYDRNNKRLTFNDSNDNSWIGVYDSRGNILVECSETKFATMYTYDSNGNVLTKKSPNIMDDTFTWDEDGNLLSHVNIAGEIRINTYDKGLPITKVDQYLVFTKIRYEHTSTYVIVYVDNAMSLKIYRNRG